MKKILLFFFAILSFSLSAQGITGKAFYKAKTTTGEDYSEMPEEKRLRKEKRDKELYEKTYILTFNNKESIYKEEEFLNEASPYMVGFLAAMQSYSTESVYKNLESQRIIEAREFLGKRFLIDDTLPKLEWELVKEAKQIGDYTVFKAVATMKIDLNDYRMKNSINEDSKEGKIQANVIVTAWYAPQIPVSNGPDEFSGLPGLILELNVNRTTFLCSKIILNTGNKNIINPPKNGEIVTFEKFESIVADKKKELKDKF
ncbi:GLPGLI family protein [Aequorivita sp. KMM 9714]|uniref:GLPGLI family protein n=1 Tax=Aequorivita sp. KMM 9714 TaxID=2707173 RepID=UPI0013ED684B|nr:GLPGLI family protein [Aequorivita sp. KMM 9714]NGX83444.1 GLPGLI family protein [Aequorivita sp. KMM 9714]